MTPSTPIGISDFAKAQISLLDDEQKAELSETAELFSQSSLSNLQKAGVAVINLVVSSQRTGFGGKTVVDLTLDTAVGNGDIPPHGIRSGDIVSVQEQPSASAKKKDKDDLKKEGIGGVVLKASGSVISVALSKEDADVPSTKLCLMKLANDVTYKRMNQTMLKLQNLSDSQYTPLIRVLFGQSKPTQTCNDADNSAEGLAFFDPNLNDSQKDAIKFAIASNDVALIHGPPGTGKTHTLIELILQLLERKLRLLVCGPSNISVDNIVERLASHKVPMVRLGHPARLLPSVLSHSLDVLTHTSEAADIVRDVRKEMDDKQASISKTRNAKERRAIYNDLKILRKEYRQRESKCVDDLVAGSKVVLATLHGAGGYQLKNGEFDVVIIDEASQALEAQCWIPLLSAKKVVLAGDHLQLPPTVKSVNSKSKTNIKPSSKESETPKPMSLEKTMFDRLLQLHGSSIKRMLTTQYRMHESIMRFPSDELYDSKLIAADSVKARLLNELPYDVTRSDDTTLPLVFWDTQGGDFPEKPEDDATENKGKGSFSMGESKSNDMEAELVKLHVHNLTKTGLKAEDIAVITPYNAQLALVAPYLRATFPGIEVGSIDGFQGREKEAVVVSLVRSNAEGEVGFLGEKRRLNVAMTRPRRHLCIIGDSDTVGRGNKYLKRWMEFLEEHADLRYPDMSSLVASN
ncbi:MAG: hypothetical protein M1829_004115 [Trizodia sp. TS-e1964]|nr:MAG: hypothetical protein M1829_004115 [Trizodia sp. TS-e1964]